MSACLQEGIMWSYFLGTSPESIDNKKFSESLRKLVENNQSFDFKQNLDKLKKQDFKTQLDIMFTPGADEKSLFELIVKNRAKFKDNTDISDALFEWVKSIHLNNSLSDINKANLVTQLHSSNNSEKQPLLIARENKFTNLEDLLGQMYVQYKVPIPNTNNPSLMQSADIPNFADEGLAKEETKKITGLKNQFLVQFDSNLITTYIQPMQQKFNDHKKNFNYTVNNPYIESNSTTAEKLNVYMLAHKNNTENLTILQNANFKVQNFNINEKMIQDNINKIAEKYLEKDRNVDVKILTDAKSAAVANIMQSVDSFTNLTNTTYNTYKSSVEKFNEEIKTTRENLNKAIEEQKLEIEKLEKQEKIKNIIAILDIKIDKQFSENCQKLTQENFDLLSDEQKEKFTARIKDLHYNILFKNNYWFQQKIESMSITISAADKPEKDKLDFDHNKYNKFCDEMDKQLPEVENLEKKFNEVEFPKFNFNWEFNDFKDEVESLNLGKIEFLKLCIDGIRAYTSGLSDLDENIDKNSNAYKLQASIFIKARDLLIKNMHDATLARNSKEFNTIKTQTVEGASAFENEITHNLPHGENERPWYSQFRVWLGKLLNLNPVRKTKSELGASLFFTNPDSKKRELSSGSEPLENLNQKTKKPKN